MAGLGVTTVTEELRLLPPQCIDLLVNPDLRADHQLP